MRKKIAILGSTGSIGKSTLKVIKKNRNDFEIILLYANNNYKELIKQAKQFKAKNVFIKNKSLYKKTKDGLKNTKTKVYSGNIAINNIISKKIDLTMAAIVGIAGLQPTIDATKISRTVAIANKESVICGWEILSKIKKKYKTKIVPVDSEHFSINELTKNIKDEDIAEIIITASGGPFLKTSKKKLENINSRQAIKHPNWVMGKKISIDSANLMNKVFEVIEACKFFKFDPQKYRILIHPQSYVHSIVRLKNGLVKMILYNADMTIPISNILYGNKKSVSNIKNISIKILNKLEFEEVDDKHFPSVKLIKKFLKLGDQAPTIVNAANEVLVSMFLDKKIRFLDIVKFIGKILKDKDFKKYARRKTKSIKDIEIIDNWARLKTLAISVR